MQDFCFEFGFIKHKILQNVVNLNADIEYFFKHFTTFLYIYGGIIFVYYIKYDSCYATNNSMFSSTYMHTRIMQDADALVHDDEGL